MAAQEKSVLFVCLGNICRSVMAESILKHMVAERGQANEWTIDSAATSDYEIGSTPDPRTNQTLKKYSIPESDHIARQIKKRDFDNFHYIFGFDESNMNKLGRLKPADSPVVLKMFGEYDPQSKDDPKIEDPYYGKMQAFETAFGQCERACRNFLDSVSRS